VAKPSLHTAGSWAEDTSGSLTATLPTHSTGDMLVVRVGYKSSAIATCLASCATAGWAKVGEFHNGTTNSGNGTGSVAVAAFWKVATSASETNPVIDFSQAQTQAVHVSMAYTLGSGDTAWNTPVGDGGGDTSAGTSHSATIQSHVTALANDLIDFFSVQCDDTTQTVPTFTQTGLTLDAVVESPAAAGSFTGGADAAGDGGYRTVASGTSSAAAVVTGTLSTTETGASWTTRLRSYAPEAHNGSVTATGGGVATVTGRLNAATSVSGTGGGVATTSATKQGLASVAATGGGVSTQTFVGAHTAVHALTGGGVATLTSSSAHVSDSVVGTGAGVASVSAFKGGQTSVSATGGGVATVSATMGAQSSVVGTGGGVATVTSSSAHAGSATGTGGGVATQTQTTARSVTSTATGGGVVVTTGQMGGQVAVTGTGGGVATTTQTTARAATVVGTGGGVATVVGTGGGGGEQHSGEVVATGGGVATLVCASARAGSVVGTASGVATVVQTTARSATVAATGGGTATVAGGSGSFATGEVTATGGGTATIRYAIYPPRVVQDLVIEALEAHDGDVFDASNWLLVVAAQRVRGRVDTQGTDPLIGSTRRRGSAATYALALVALGVTGPVLEELKRVGGVPS
jgi:hypothetical protein